MIFEHGRRHWNRSQSEPIKLGALIVARMDSKRYPGKVVEALKGKPLIEWIVTRLNEVNSLKGHVAIATTSRPVDDPINRLGQKLFVPVFRSQFDLDVSCRLLNACEFFQWDGFFRINGDSPFVDPSLLSKAVELWKREDLDFITNLKPRSFPYGVSCEGIRNSILKKNIESFTESQREHVTEWFYKNIEDLNYTNISAQSSYNCETKLAVDLKEDLLKFESALEGIDTPINQISIPEIYKNLTIQEKTTHSVSI